MSDANYYRTLLVKYIAHVGHAEGSTFLANRERSRVPFTEEEWGELLALDDESLAY